MKLPVQLSDFLDAIPAVLQAPHRSMQCTYDEPADVIYMNFAPGAEATDSELGPDMGDEPTKARGQPWSGAGQRRGIPGDRLDAEMYGRILCLTGGGLRKIHGVPKPPTEP